MAVNRVSSLGIAVAYALLLTGSSVFAQPQEKPDPLAPPKGNVLLFELRAEGFQVYEGKPKAGDSAAFEWVLKAPDAILYDERGDKAGTHGAGPNWLANDGSKIVAAKSASAPAPGRNAVPWLLLQVKSHEGKGVFSKVTYIQRVDTWAGLPSVAATKDNAGKELRVRYQATYRFFGPTP